MEWNEINVNGMTILHPGTWEEAKEHKQFLEARHNFSLKYMAEKGWGSDVSKLTVQQILEIRSQTGWKTPAYQT